MTRFLTFLAVLLAAAACARAPQQPPSPAPARGDVARLATYPRFGDTDPHDWQGRGPSSYAIHGIDVARYQGAIDWPRVRAAGVSFAYLKATEGGDLLAERFQENWKGARRAGIPRGAYHYFYFCRPAEEQARWFIRNVPRSPGALPHVLDMEWNPFSKTCTKRPGGAVVRAEAKRFLDMLERHYGKRPVLYTTVDFYRQTGIGRLRGTEFWLRSVAGHPKQVYPGARWRFWQYSGTGVVPGIEGEVDLNVFHDSPETWLRWSGQI
jgi:lysozyme